MGDIVKINPIVPIVMSEADTTELTDVLKASANSNMINLANDIESLKAKGNDINILIRFSDDTYQCSKILIALSGKGK